VPVGQFVGQNGLLVLGNSNALTTQCPCGIWCMVLGNKCLLTAFAAFTQQTSATNAASGTHLTQMWHYLLEQWVHIQHYRTLVKQSRNVLLQKIPCCGVNGAPEAPTQS